VGCNEVVELHGGGVDANDIKEGGAPQWWLGWEVLTIIVKASPPEDILFVHWSVDKQQSGEPLGGWHLDQRPATRTKTMKILTRIVVVVCSALKQDSGSMLHIDSMIVVEPRWQGKVDY
jgi:hypothetical protein